jgi:hypothetical protein
MDLHVYLHIVNDDRTSVRLDSIQNQLNSMETKMGTVAEELAALVIQAAAKSSAIDRAILIINGIADLTTAAGVDPAALAALTAELKTKDDELAAAIVAVPTV